MRRESTEGWKEQVFYFISVYICININKDYKSLKMPEAMGEDAKRRKNVITADGGGKLKCTGLF